MHDHDRERLSASIALAVLLHAVVAVVFWLAGWARVEPYPEYTPPLYVDLESTFVPDDPPEAVEEPPEELNLEEPAPAQPEQAEPAPSEPAATEEAPPADTPPAADVAPPQPDEPATEPSTETSAPAASPPPTDSPTVPADQPPAEAEPQQTFDFEGDIATLYGREERDDAPPRPADDGFFEIPEESAEEPQDLPDWVTAVMDDSGISTEGMETQEIEELATKIERDPELEALMRRANQAIEQGRVPQAETSGSDSPRRSESASPATETIAENASIQWSGPEGGRGTGGDLPSITASDFQGPIPPRITFVVAFDVNSQGVVIPGSVLVQRRSGYTQVDRKVRSAILGWKFFPKPGADRETGVFTLVVERQDIR